MNSFEQIHRIRQQGQDNQLSMPRSNQNSAGNGIDFQAKYKKALKQIYQVIQANKKFKQQLDRLKSSRHNIDSNRSELRKDEYVKGYEEVLKQKSQLLNINQSINLDRQRLSAHVEKLQAQLQMLSDQKMNLAQQKKALELNIPNFRNQNSEKDNISQDRKIQDGINELQQKHKEKECQFHQAMENYEQHHIALAKQNKKAEDRIQQLEDKVLINEKNWRNRFQAKQLQFSDIKTSIRHQYQDQINNLRRQVNSLKMLNNQLMTKLQTVEMDYNDNQRSQTTQYQLDMLNSLRQLRVQMEPMKKQIIQLQEINSFEKEQTEREKTSLQMKVYELDTNIQRYAFLVKNQEDKILALNQQISYYQQNDQKIKKLQQQNKMLGGRLIVLQSKDLVSLQKKPQNSSSNRLEQKVLQFQTRVQMLLNEKQNIGNLKNVSIHQLITLKSYIVQMDQRLKTISNENEFALKKYKSYKQKYLTVLQQKKQHQSLQNSLKVKIMGYDKLVQRLQSQLQKNVHLSQVEIINQNARNTQDMSQVEVYKKKYLALKEKSILQQKYSKQQLETSKLNFQTKIVDLLIKNQEVNNLRQTISLMRQKNEDLMRQIALKQHQILQIRISTGKQASLQNQSVSSFDNYSKQKLSSLQQTIFKQQALIFKLQSQIKQQQDGSRLRIDSLQRELRQSQSELNRQRLTVTGKLSQDRSVEDLLNQNKKLKNKIIQLDNQIIIIKRSSTQQNSQQLVFKISSLQIQKSQLTYKLQAQISARKRLDKQMQQQLSHKNQLQAEINQLNMQRNRKGEQHKNEINNLQIKIQTLQTEIQKLKQRVNLKKSTNLDSSTILLQSSKSVRQQTLLPQNKLLRLQQKIRDLQYQNQQLANKISNSTNLTTANINFQKEALKQDKEEMNRRLQRTQNDNSKLKEQINRFQQQIYDLNRITNQLKSQLSEQKLQKQNQIYQKTRIILQLQSKVGNNQINTNQQPINSNQQPINQFDYNQTILLKDRQINQLKSKIYKLQQSVQQLNIAINQYNRQIINLKGSKQSSTNSYVQHLESGLQEKQRMLSKFKDQYSLLSHQLNEKTELLSLKQRQEMKLKRQLGQYQNITYEIDQMKLSLNDRQRLLNKNKYQLNQLQQANDRLNSELSYVKNQLQKTKFDLIQKEDQISRLALKISSEKQNMANQLHKQLDEHIQQKQAEVSALNLQIQSLRAQYFNLQNDLNESETRQRKLQSQNAYLKADINKALQDIEEQTLKNIKTQSQISQLNSRLVAVSYVEDELNQKSNLLSKFKSQLTQCKIQNSHLSEELSYFNESVAKMNSQINSLKRTIYEKQQIISQNEIELRKFNNQFSTLQATTDQTVFVINDKELAISRLNNQLKSANKRYHQLEEQIQERQQEWSNITYELNQAKNQINSISDQIESKDANLTKLYNQTAHLKQQVMNLNETIVQKNHEINRINQQIFTQKMQFTQNMNEQIQKLSRKIFTLQQNISSLNHTIEDLQYENRRIKIQISNSRVNTLDQQNSQYIYTQEDMSVANEERNKNYRKISQLQQQIDNYEYEMEHLNNKIKQLQNQMNNINSGNEEEISNLTKQVEYHMQNQHQLQRNMQQMRDYYQNQLIKFSQNYSNFQHPTPTTNSQQDNHYKEEQLKHGLHLYTQQTDRLHKIIQGLNEQCSALKLRFTAVNNQDSLMQQNLITLVMSFAQIQALRSRLNKKQGQINEVRRSFIQAISSNDLSNGKSLKTLQNTIEQQSKKLIFNQIKSIDQISFDQPNPDYGDDHIMNKKGDTSRRMNDSKINQLNLSGVKDQIAKTNTNIINDGILQTIIDPITHQIKNQGLKYQINQIRNVGITINSQPSNQSKAGRSVNISYQGDNIRQNNQIQNGQSFQIQSQMNSGQLQKGQIIQRNQAQNSQIQIIKNQINVPIQHRQNSFLQQPLLSNAPIITIQNNQYHQTIPIKTVQMNKMSNINVVANKNLAGKQFGNLQIIYHRDTSVQHLIKQ